MPFRPASAGRGGFAGRDFGVDSQIANLAGDQMAVLSARVEDGDLWVQILV